MLELAVRMAGGGVCQGLVIPITAVAVAITQPCGWPAPGGGTTQAAKQHLHIRLGSGQLAVMRKGCVYQAIQLRVLVQRPPILR
ncbi:hypothetical protein D3C85_1530310 [compost metagenome]